MGKLVKLTKLAVLQQLLLQPLTLPQEMQKYLTQIARYLLQGLGVEHLPSDLLRASSVLLPYRPLVQLGDLLLEQERQPWEMEASAHHHRREASAA